MSRCEDCADIVIAYNRCRNRHCPKSRSRQGMARRSDAELLPVDYFHLVFTLPDAIADIAHQNKVTIYGCCSRNS
jgi:hypothetical protein